MKPPDVSYFTMLAATLNRPKDSRPRGIVPSVKTDLKNLPSDKPVIVWFGHSSYLIHAAGLNILVDPVFSGHASPFSFMVKAFPGSDAYSIEDLPPIDVLLITHNHYDHLDSDTVKKILPGVKSVYTSLGVGKHLEEYGLAAQPLTELDWWETATLPLPLPLSLPSSTPFPAAITPTALTPDTSTPPPHTPSPLSTTANLSSAVPTAARYPQARLTATPARHFSGRGLKRGGTLWSSFVLQIDGYTLYLGGDSGYDTHFKEIGERFGPFDLAILECGQYNAYWPYIHMMPEQTVQAALDLGAKRLLPVHWAKFALSLHAWNEPIRRVTREAAEKGLPLTTPLIGEPVVVGESYPQSHWWE